MERKCRLDSGDREFFRLVGKVAFSNPFSAECADLLRSFAGAKNEEGEELVRLATSSVQQRIDKMAAQDRANFTLYASEDRDLMRISLLYDAYHRFTTRFDDLIQTQRQTGDAPCPVPFVKEALALLRDRGFAPEVARHYFAFYYQLRRAFYFIHLNLIGKCPSMEQLRCHLWNNIFTSDPRWYERFLWDRMEDFSTFLVGETGTGKGTAARAIGCSGFIPFDEKRGKFTDSFTSNFIEINLSQFPETLIESELFGHKKGAFTGAVEHHQGVFARCRPYGAIFLDEIGEVSVPIQIKLLKVLQERTFTVVGGHDHHRFHGRVIAATNRPLETLRNEGQFRDDFYYRLCSDMIEVPPLRKQLAEDPKALDTLLDHTMVRIIGEPAPELLVIVRKTLDRDLGPNYPWPGNVRELEQAVRRILLTRNYTGDVVKQQPALQGRIEQAMTLQKVKHLWLRRKVWSTPGLNDGSIKGRSVGTDYFSQSAITQFAVRTHREQGDGMQKPANDGGIIKSDVDILQQFLAAGQSEKQATQNARRFKAALRPKR